MSPRAVPRTSRFIRDLFPTHPGIFPTQNVTLAHDTGTLSHLSFVKNVRVPSCVLSVTAGPVIATLLVRINL